MDEKKTPPQPSYIGMTRICNECMEEQIKHQPKTVFDQTFVKSLCKAACKSGACKLTQKP